MEKSITHKLQEILDTHDSLDPKEIDSAENILRENAGNTAKQSVSMLVSFFVTFFSWELIKSATIEKVKIFGIELTNSNVLLTLLPFLATFIFYRFMVMMMMHQVIADTLDKIYSKKYPNLQEIGITELFHFPSLVGIEHMFTSIEYVRGVKDLNRFWLFLIAIVIFLLPVIMIIVMLVEVVKIKSFLSLILFAFSILVLVKSTILFIRTLAFID